ncbi:unnamed protein product [Allacma fusca]|uniref:Uncharacterized protein n=1 Tax=Allacma fusca TaxID=39272 RepID=A0A8J2JZS2_9HEXA|nr:unnamed protein product [Allacma fusca]
MTSRNLILIAVVLTVCALSVTSLPASFDHVSSTAKRFLRSGNYCNLQNVVAGAPTNQASVTFVGLCAVLKQIFG